MPLPPQITRTILHVDLDAFYASVEAREHPDFRGVPVVVGADPRGGRGRGVVAAASYEARVFGIHSAMPISQAYRRCPHAVFVRPRGRLYAAVSRRFMAILHRYTDLVEPLSIDEAFLDVGGSRALFGDGERIGRRIKEDVRREEDITASIGVAPSKFLAKVASDLSKPNGLIVVPDHNIGPFLDQLPVERLWGAGPRTVVRFHRLGLHTIGEVARAGANRLVSAFGASLGTHFYELACGVDPRLVVPDHERKSVSCETTFSEDESDRRLVARTLLDLVEQVTHRLRQKGLAGQTVTVKLRTADFVTITRRETLRVVADTTEVVWPVAQKLLRKADVTSQAIRLVGVSISHFSGVPQLPLFTAAVEERSRKIAGAIDAVTARFGEKAVTRGSLLDRPVRHQR